MLPLTTDRAYFLQLHYPMFGKDEVTGSNPVISSRNPSEMKDFLLFWGHFCRILDANLQNQDLICFSVNNPSNVILSSPYDTMVWGCISVNQPSNATQIVTFADCFRCVNGCTPSLVVVLESHLRGRVSEHLLH